ncbi:MAG: hypothetical protein ACO3A2_10520 [Bdellovibrionia bacterium]
MGVVQCLISSRGKWQRGQATTEYILLLAVTVGFYLMIIRGMGRLGVSQRLMQPLTRDFASAYQYGKIPSAKERIFGDDLRPLTDAYFRVFLNPK